ncbi:50S ribosomal protein L3 [compost metagenome]
MTTPNLKVVSADPERGILLVRGAVPGAQGSFVLIRDAVKRKLPKDVPFPAAIRATGDGAAAEKKE